MNFQKNDPTKAQQFFQDKITYTCGPVELNHNIEDKSDMAVIDVRAAKDYQSGHVPGAINLPKDRWESMEGMDKSKLNVLYCYSQVCHLAAMAAFKFSSKGYSVMEMEGGFKAWKEHNMEVEGAPTASKSGKSPRWQPSGQQ